MIFRIVINKIFKGHVRDVRSDSEESEEESGESIELNGSLVSDEQRNNSNSLKSNGLAQGKTDQLSDKDMRNGAIDHDGSINS